jgi:CheY-like chemotaxis protein
VIAMPHTSTTARYSSVLLVDDSELDSFVTRRILENCHFADRIYCHSCGSNAIDFLKHMRAEGKRLPEVIFLDVNMPKMDGFDFIKEFDKISVEDRTAIKVVMFTCSVNPVLREHSRRYPSVYRFIHKPLSRDVLYSI